MRLGSRRRNALDPIVEINDNGEAPERDHCQMYQPRHSEFHDSTRNVAALVPDGLPDRFVLENKSTLSDILEELEGTYETELPWLNQVKRLRIGRPASVHKLREKLELYNQGRLWEPTRTKCGLIREMTNGMLARHRATGNEAFVDDVTAALGPLLDRDDEFIADIEHAIDDACTAVVKIDDYLQAGNAALAEKEHASFVDGYDTQIAMLQTRLVDLRRSMIELEARF